MQDRHAQEGLIDLLAGLREVREVGVGLRVGAVLMTVPWAAIIADQALADAQPRVWCTASRDSPGREQLERLAGAVQVDRAHLGHDVRAISSTMRSRRCCGATGSATTSTNRRKRPATRNIRSSTRLGAVLRTAATGRGRHGAQTAERRPLAAPLQRVLGLPHELGQERDDRLHPSHQPDALAGHQRAVLDVALDHGPTQRARPEMLDRERRLLIGELATAIAPDDLDLRFGEPARRIVGDRAYRDHLELRVDLNGRRQRHGRPPE